MEHILPLDARIEKMLYSMGIVPTYRGYARLAAAVGAACGGAAPGRTLYAAIAAAQGGTAAGVRANIRAVMRRAQKVGGPFCTRVTGWDGLGAPPSTDAFVLACAAWVCGHAAVLGYDPRFDMATVRWKPII